MNSAQRKIGFEFEFPAVNADTGIAITHDDIESLWKQFVEAHPEWSLYIEEYTKAVTGVTRTHQGFPETINTDRGVCTIEFSLRPYDNILDAEKEFKELFHSLLLIADSLNIKILATGLQPITWFDRSIATKKDWYKVIDRMMVHWEYAIPFAAHQANVDMSVDEWVPAVNVLGAFSGPIMALCASSPIREGKESEFKETRAVIWRQWKEKYPKTIGDYLNNQIHEKPYNSINDYLKFFWDSTFFFVTSNKSAGYEIDGRPRFIDFIRSNKKWKAKGIDDTIEIAPENSQLNYIHLYGWLSIKAHYSFNDDATIQKAVEAYDNNELDVFCKKYIKNLYVEFRPTDVAAKGEESAMPALILGLLENLDAAHSLMKKHSWEWWLQFREEAEKTGLAFATEADVKRETVQEILQIAKAGLEKRGKGEERCLEPFQKRADSGITNADELLETFHEGGVPLVIKKHSYTPEDFNNNN